MKSAISIFLCAVISGLIFRLGYAATVDLDAETENSDLLMGNMAVLSSLVAGASKKGRYACAQKHHACAGPDKAELGLAIIAARQTERSTAALANLLRFRLDAGISEEYSSRILQRKKSIVGKLSNIDAQALSRGCVKDVDEMKRRTPQLYSDVQVDHVCNGEDKIKQRAMEMKQMYVRIHGNTR